jgi:hypothetical protein
VTVGGWYGLRRVAFPMIKISPGNYLLMPKHLTLNHECKLFGFCKKRPAGFSRKRLTCYKREAGRYQGETRGDRKTWRHN